MRALRIIGAIFVCIFAGLVSGAILSFGARALGAPPADMAAIIDLWPLWAAIIGAVWMRRVRKSGEQL